MEGRRRLIDRCRTRPIAHVAAGTGISRACASKWVNRYRRHGELGLEDLLFHTAPPADRDTVRGPCTHRRAASDPQMVCRQDRLRAGPGRKADQLKNREQALGRDRHQPAPIHRPQWRGRPPAAEDPRPTARPHDPRRREEGGPHP
ncbi:leucine zipper domain-containing protein [Spirillospora sp. NPDC047279]|uniref:helix-turn-helix domain-containing protein n=1 Tax=Spirillospora sp. NPDC047279 TaxID=3155478 RepID=UPI0033E7108B